MPFPSPEIDADALRLLVLRAQKGDAEAMTAIIEATQLRLSRFCRLLSRNPTLAQDLVQETFVRALEELPKLKETDKFLSWLFRIARNLFLDWVKSPRYSASDSLEESVEAGEELPEGLRDPGAQEFTAHLHKVLGDLPPEDRTLLLLIDLEEYSYKEAAEIVGLSESTVKFRLHHIRKKFVDLYRAK